MPWAEEQSRERDLVDKLQEVVESYQPADRCVDWPVAMVRAVKPHTSEHEFFDIGYGVVVRTGSWRIYLHGQPAVGLSPSAGRVLHLLATSDVPLSTGAIASRLHGLGAGTIYNAISMLKRRLPKPLTIRAIRGVGYVLERSDGPVRA